MIQHILFFQMQVALSGERPKPLLTAPVPLLPGDLLTGATFPLNRTPCTARGLPAAGSGPQSGCGSGLGRVSSEPRLGEAQQSGEGQGRAGGAGQGGREAEARQPACRAGGLLGGERGLQACLGWGPLGSTSAGAVVTQ